VRYLIARARSKTIANLLPILESSFDHSWVVGVEFRIRFWPGNETRLAQLWRLYKELPRQNMHWDAPIAFSIFRGHRGKRRQALCMSLYLVGSVVSIRQLQGIPGTDTPKELREWPKILMESCRTFARQERLSEVRVPVASTLYSYRNPTIPSRLTPEARQHARQRIRRSMGLLYDQNALSLGFVRNGDWLVWKNPEWQARTREIL
jgi:hypothetical protein